MINKESLLSSSSLTETDETPKIEQDEYTTAKLIIGSIQTAGSFILELAPNTITLYFLSQTHNNLWISSFGIGMTWANCLGMGPLNALAVGQETLISQAYGSEKFKLCGEFYYRTLFADLIMMGPVFLIMYFGGDILYALNGNYDLSSNAGLLTKFLVLQIYLDGVHVSTKCLLNGQNIYNYQVYSQMITVALHFLWCYLYIDYFQLGLIGCALSKTTTDFLNPLFLYIIIKITKCSEKTLIKFEAKQLKNTFKFFKSAFPIGSLLWLEWVCYELYSMQASYLDESELTANFIMTNFVTLYYQFSYGCSIAASTIVGYQMGNQNVKKAKGFSLISFYIIGLFLIISQVALYFCRTQFYHVFTEDIQVEQQLESTFWHMSLLCILDGNIGLQAYLTGIVRAIGRENFACISFVFFYLGVGQLIAYLLTFQYGYGLQGIWLGMVIGAGGYDLLQVLNLLISDWEKLQGEIQEKLEKHEKHDSILVEDY